MIDFHCHLDLFPDPIEIAEECRKRGLYVLAVTTTPSAWVKSNRIGTNNKRIKTALGLHPQLAFEKEKELSLFDNLLPKVKYVGEIGLDGSPGYNKTWDAQVRVFYHILNSCQKNGGKIMSIHSRKAEKKVIDLLSAFPKAGIPILHWYTGNLLEIKRAVEIGCWFSINPTMVQTKSGIRIIQEIPKSRIVPETDSPFTVKHGTPYKPWDVEFVFQGLSKIWNLSITDTNKLIWENCKKLLGTKL
ncbi:MAG: Qat anti-phage system TatD family nuclease QatD [Bacteroidales bacterium]